MASNALYSLFICAALPLVASWSNLAITTPPQRFVVWSGSTMRLPCHVEGADGEVENATIVWYRNGFSDAWLSGRRWYSWHDIALWDRGNVTLHVEHGKNQSRFSLEREGNNFMLILPNATLNDARAYQCRSACNDHESCPCWKDDRNAGYKCSDEFIRRFYVIHNVVIAEPARIENAKNYSSYQLAAGSRTTMCEKGPRFASGLAEGRRRGPAQGCARKTLPCEATGTRSVNITWYLNGTQIYTTVAPEITAAKCFSCEPSGLSLYADVSNEGLYMCVATNEYGSAAVTFNVSVWAGPIEEPRIPKREYHRGRDILVHRGYDVTLSCNASGQPPPEFEWRRNNTIIFAGDRYLLDGNTFTVFNVRPSDNAMFTCYARNLGGFDYVEYYLEVSDKSFVSVSRNSVAVPVLVAFIVLLVLVIVVLSLFIWHRRPTSAIRNESRGSTVHHTPLESWSDLRDDD